MENDWRRKETWDKFGRNFCVQVVHHTVPTLPDDMPRMDYSGEDRWNVYVYIYEKHPLFKEFKDGDEDHIFCDAAVSLPIHGHSFIAKHVAKGRVTSWQVGGDYNHLGDNQYTFMKTREEAPRVFFDAQDLYNYMQSKEVVEPEQLSFSI